MHSPCTVLAKHWNANVTRSWQRPRRTCSKVRSPRDVDPPNALGMACESTMRAIILTFQSQAGFDADSEYRIVAVYLHDFEQPGIVFHASYSSPSTYRYNPTCSAAQRTEQTLEQVELRKCAVMKCFTGRFRCHLSHALVLLALPCTRYFSVSVYAR